MMIAKPIAASGGHKFPVTTQARIAIEHPTASGLSKVKFRIGYPTVLRPYSVTAIQPIGNSKSK